MKSIYTIVLVSSFLLIAGNTFAQRKLKYKDVFAAVGTQTKEEAFLKLFDFQKQEPEFPNTYLQLGMISLEWMNASDPLVDITETRYLIYNAKLFLGLAKGKLIKDDKDVRSNKKYYQNIPMIPNMDDVEYEIVIDFIDKKLAFVNEYEKNVEIIVYNYDKTVSKYNYCIELFKSINSEHNKLKDIFLSSSPDLRSRIMELALEFDSVTYYFQEYKTALTNYPIKNYKQNLKILPIETFRLNGLTGSDFLQDVIPVWDYRAWVNSVIALVDYDLAKLRTELDLLENTLNKQFTDVTRQDAYSDSYIKLKLDDKLIFKIERFDYKSIMSAYITWRYAQLAYLTEYQKTINNPNDTLNSETSVAKRARYYVDLISLKQQSDSLLTVFATRITQKNVSKFNDFFIKYYKNETGLSTYINNQRKLNTDFLSNSFSNYKQFIITEINRFGADSISLPYKNSAICLYVNVVDYALAQNNKYYTQSIAKDKFGNYYISGYLKFANNSSQAFIAKTIKNTEIEWVKTNNINVNAYDCAFAVEPANPGCFVIINSKLESVSKNILIRFDETGKQLSKTELDQSTFPRYLGYDEINDRVLVAYKGNKFDELNEGKSDLVMQQFRLSENVSTWTNSISMAGVLTDIVKMDQSYRIFCNVTSIVNEKGTELVSKAGSADNTNIAVITITDAGQITNTSLIESAKAQHAVKVIKVDSETINITGFENKLENKYKITKATNNGNFMTIILSRNGDLLYSNLKNK